ncbi:putative sulfate/molybdate transporter [Haloarcula sp. 1CSR25-25]|uniref:putative sulfate/molybdate transporter n=1 Tax=Haloarcula sp. 1CSR25-25 TaxID=2862545 RepID=UPI0028962AF8|nr:putative sulfate/molybdate transporter [Haloarcula sp. 1CSR25-25]MDT3437335.1 putative sulfate/molybdate transporter [Haloarcula sp. 1CSR25-25]
MAITVTIRDDRAFTLSWSEATGAIGDSVTVLPIVVSVAVLTDLSLALMLVWFGIFQIVWGFYYRAPISVEPMKAVAALVIAGSITTGELLVAGLLLGVVLLTIGTTGSLERFGQYIGSPVVRGIQFGVALVLVETGIRLGSTNLQLAALAAVVAAVLIALGYWNMSGFVVLLLGGALAVLSTGLPSPSLPPTDSMALFGSGNLTLSALEAAVAQLAMTLGNAALATSVLLADYFDRDVSADDLSTSMGFMNLIAIPFGALPMCHGSGGVAGKYAFGARTVGANVILGLGYVTVALLAVEIVNAYPVAMLGIILALIALQLGRTSIEKADEYPLVIGIGILGLLVNLGVAFVVGIVAHIFVRRYDLW